MSLKAKIEAVIYASEEPVTLAQLTGLLGHEAQAELDHLDAAQHRLTLEPPPSATDSEATLDPAADHDDLNSEVLEAPVDQELRTEAPEPTEHSNPAEQPNPTQEPDAPRPALEDVGSTTADTPETATTASEAEATGLVPGEPTPDDKKSPRESKEEKERARRLREYFRTILDELIADYARQSNDRGLEIREVAGGYRLATKPEYHDAVRGFVKSLKPPLKLSLQALETLAVVAYKQPVTAPEVSEIRGVDSGGVLGSLITRKLITTAGRKQVIGRPILYKTTKDFLLRFGLKDISELPSIEEFEKMAGELAEQEEIPMEHHAPESAEALEPERHTHAPQADGSPDTADNPLDIEVEDALDDNPLHDGFSDIRPRDGEPAPSDVQDEAETIPVDGRISGPPPAYNHADDPSAAEAEIQEANSPKTGS